MEFDWETFIDWPSSPEKTPNQSKPEGKRKRESSHSKTNKTTLKRPKKDKETYRYYYYMKRRDPKQWERVKENRRNKYYKDKIEKEEKFKF